MIEKGCLANPTLGFDCHATGDRVSGIPTGKLTKYLDTIEISQNWDIVNDEKYLVRSNLGHLSSHKSASLAVGENARMISCYGNSNGAIRINKRCGDQIAGVATVHACGSSMVTVGLNEAEIIANDSSTIYVDKQTHNSRVVFESSQSRVITPAEFPSGFITLDGVLSQKLACQGRRDNLVCDNRIFRLPHEITSLPSLWGKAGEISDEATQVIKAGGGEIIVDANGEMIVILLAENNKGMKIRVTFARKQVPDGKGFLSPMPVMIGVNDLDPEVDLLASPTAHT